MCFTNGSGLVRPQFFEDRLDALEVGEGVHALGALAQFTDRLRSAEEEDAEDGLLSLGEVGVFVLDRVLAFGTRAPAWWTRMESFL